MRFLRGKLPLFLALLVAAASAACAPGYYSAGVAMPAPGIEVAVAPPAPLVETVTVAPGPGSFWVRGRWHWSGSSWGWQTGSWRAARAGYRYVPGSWVAGPRGRYAFVPGRWRPVAARYYR